MIAGVTGGSVTLGRSPCRRPCVRPPQPHPAVARPAGAPGAGPCPAAAPLRPPGLDELPRAEAPRALPARIAAAARAFSAGDGYLTGLLVDRVI